MTARGKINSSWESGALTAMTSASEISISITPGRQSRVEILQFFALRASGAATTWGPRLSKTGAAGRAAFAYATSSAVGTEINDVFTAPVPIQTDTDGTLTLEPRFDSGSNNAASFSIEYRIVEG